jgi:hypothetical protein
MTDSLNTGALTVSQALGNLVVVVGTGPIGLTFALGLTRRGMPSLIVNAAEDISHEGFRAIFPPFVNLAQADTAAMLLAAARATYPNLIELHVGHRVVAPLTTYDTERRATAVNDLARQAATRLKVASDVSALVRA